MKCLKRWNNCWRDDSKVDSCIEAIHNGVNKAHIIDGRVEHSILLELFTSDGIGTQFIRVDNPNNGIDIEKLLNS